MASPPTLSVILPVHNEGQLLAECLDRLFESQFRDFEVIVVDDASTDETPDIARMYDVQVLRMPCRSGPAKARNVGASVARGEYLVFIDADVRVHGDTLDRLVQTFLADPAVDAVFGSYDTAPSAPNFISHYKNLFHHYVHQKSHEQASTFWSGCGAIKRRVFAEVGGFDPGFDRPTVEDIELGIRLRRAGHQIALNKHVLVTHAKWWNLRGMIKSDIFDRAIPWTRLILREGALANDLNLTWPQRISAALTCGLFGILAVGVVRNPALISIPLFILVLLLAIDSWSARTRIPKVARWVGVVVMLIAMGLAGFFLQQLGFVSLVLAAVIVGLNARFYGFFARERNVLFAVAVFPLHLLYYAYSVVAFVFVAAWHLPPRIIGTVFPGTPSTPTHEGPADGWRHSVDARRGCVSDKTG